MTGKQFRNLRRRIGVSQQQFAQLLGIRTNTQARKERGELPVRDTEAMLAEMIVKQS
jgi:transcriptional regulator with XRE-family HTH domain